MSRIAALALAALLACSKPAPSPDYAAARRLHADLLAAHPSDAATRPEMDEVVARLDRVPADSADASAAAELRARIEAERAAAAQDAARRAALVAGVQPGGVRPPDAPPLRIAPGLSLAELRAGEGACFESRGTVEMIEGEQKQPAEALRLVESPDCAERHPAQVGKVLLFAGDRLAAIRPAEDVKTPPPTRVEKVERLGEVVDLPGGKRGVRRPDGSVEPIPEGAEVRDEAPAPAPGAAPAGRTP
jgi:hypothetical protein